MQCVCNALIAPRRHSVLDILMDALPCRIFGDRLAHNLLLQVRQQDVDEHQPQRLWILLEVSVVLIEQLLPVGQVLEQLAL